MCQVQLFSYINKFHSFGLIYCLSNLLVLERKSSNIKLMLSLKGFNGLSLDTSKNVFALKSLIPQL